MKIYPRNKDERFTFTLRGEKVRKDDDIIEFYGEIDELTCWVGVVISHLDEIGNFEEKEKIKNFLVMTQNRLLEVVTFLSGKETEGLDEWVRSVEAEISCIGKDLQPLGGFILPGGSKISSFIHVARCVCRRVERRIVRLASVNKLNGDLVKYFNRLSDYFFALARYLNFATGFEDMEKR